MLRYENNSGNQFMAVYSLKEEAERRAKITGGDMQTVKTGLEKKNESVSWQVNWAG